MNRKFSPLRLLLWLIILGGAAAAILIGIGFWREYFRPGQPIDLDALIGVHAPAPLAPAATPGTAPKTLWDLFQALTFPVFLAIASVILERTARDIDARREEERRKGEKLKEYLNTFEGLILEKNLVGEDASSPVRAIAYAYTRDLVKDLDGSRLGALIDLLETHTLELIDAEDPVIDLSGLALKQIDLSGRKITNINLHNVQMNDSTWRKTVCVGSNLSQSTFQGSNLEGAEFYDCDLDYVDFRRANLRKAIFENCRLKRANFSAADLRGASFPGSNVSAVEFDRRTRFDLKWAIVFHLVNRPRPGRRLRGEDLSEADLSGAFMQGGSFDRCDFTSADLTGAHLEGAVLSGARFHQAILEGILTDDQTKLDERWRAVSEVISAGAEGADLSGQDLSGAFLYGVSFAGANLRGTIFTGADLRYADFNGADLTGARLSSELDDEDGDIEGDRRSGWSLAGWWLLRLRWLRFRFPELWERLPAAVDAWIDPLSGPSPSFATLMGTASLQNANLKNADFTETDLAQVNLSGAIDYQEARLDPRWRVVAEFVNSKAEPRECPGGDLRDADLSEMRLQGANLAGANLRGANLHLARLNAANLTNAILSGADLTGADLTNADLSYADLSDADLSGAILKYADLTSATADRARVSKVQLRSARSYDGLSMKDVRWIIPTSLD